MNSVFLLCFLCFFNQNIGDLCIITKKVVKTK